MVLITAGRFGGFFVAFLLICSFTCQGARFYWRRHICRTDTAISISAKPSDSIMVHYTGCSGFFISKGNNVLLFDPFFSYNVALRSRLISSKRKISPRLTNEIDTVFNRAIGETRDHKGVISALIIDHAHVDHLGDIPYLLDNGYLRKDMKIIGNTTAGHYIRGNVSDVTNIVDSVESSAATRLSGGKWIYVNSHTRVMPIVSEHGPHIKVLGLKISFASGRHEMEDRTRRYPLCYGTGQTLSYVVDFLNDDGSINFRIYHSSAAMNTPYGFPPASVLSGRRIDLAILCAASFNQVNDYPNSIIRYLMPRHIIFSHWEGFLFASYSGVKKHSWKNFAYSYRKLFKRVNHTLHDLNNKNGDISYSIPNVDTRMKFYY